MDPWARAIDVPGRQRGLAAKALTGIVKPESVGPPLVGSTPVCTRQWQAVLADADLPAQWSRVLGNLEQAANLLAQVDDSSVRVELRRIIREASTHVVNLSVTARQVAWFRPLDLSGGRPEDAVEFSRAACAAVRLAVASLQDPTESGNTVVEQTNKASTALAKLLMPHLPWVPNTAVSDVWQEIYGISDLGVLDGPSSGGGARVLAHSPFSETVLSRRVAAALRHLVPEAAAAVPHPTAHPLLVFSAPRPLKAHQVALLTRDLVLATWDQDGVRCAHAVVNAMEREGELATAHRMVFNAERALASVEDDDPAGAFAVLAPQYAAAAEGFGTYMANVVLALNDLEMPEDASLTQALQRLPKDNLLSTLLLDAIDKDWRNGSAHAKLVWDPVRQVPLISNRPTTLAALSARTGLLLSIWNGFELGVAVAKHSQASLARAIDDLAGGWDRGVILEVLAAQVCASHGLDVRHVRRAGTEVKIVLTKDHPDDWLRAVAAVSEMAGRTPTVETWTLVPYLGSPQTIPREPAAGPSGA